MHKFIFLTALLLVAILLAGCAAGPNDYKNIPDEQGDVAGFFTGLWHGIIAPITFLISLFNKSINIYEVHNNGGWYNFGFLLGIGALTGGGGSSAARARRSS